MTPEIQTFLSAMVPFGELRLSLPIALVIHNLNWSTAYFISVIGNLVPVVFFLLFLEPLSAFFSRKSKICQRLFTWLFDRTRKKYNSTMEKYGYPGLVVFVAIPLPMTGGWTASLIAFLFAIPFKKAFPLITLGVLIAGLIVSAVTMAGISIEKYFGWQMLIGILLAIGFIWLLFKIKRKKESR